MFSAASGKAAEHCKKTSEKLTISFAQKDSITINQKCETLIHHVISVQSEINKFISTCLQG